MDKKIIYGLIGLGVVGAGVGGYFLWKHYNQISINPDQEIFDNYIKEGGGSTEAATTSKGQALIDVLNNTKEYTGKGITSQGMNIKFGEKIYKQRNPDVEKAYPNDGGALYHYTHYGYKNQITDTKSPRRAVFLDNNSWKFYEIDEVDYFTRFKDVANDARYGKLPAAIHYIEQGWKEKRQANMIEVTA